VQGCVDPGGLAFSGAPVLRVSAGHTAPLRPRVDRRGTRSGCLVGFGLGRPCRACAPNVRSGPAGWRSRSWGHVSRSPAQCDEIVGAIASAALRWLGGEHLLAQLVEPAGSAASANALAARTDSGPRKHRIRYSTATAPAAISRRSRSPETSSNWRQSGHCGSSKTKRRRRALELPTTTPPSGV
jgi:hypothetical protein